ncbi:MAG: tetratricopeptide repeat protein, partial [Phycisphaerales bacterium]|nr:tetratricopeptide repeat protein [Phycisphaerales bacterium]
RAAKFIRRNTVGVVATAVIFLLLIGGAGVAVFGLLQVRAEADKAKQLNRLLQRIFTIADPQRNGRDVTVREMLDSAAERFETELADQPEARASLHRTLGLTYLGLGVYRSAEAQLQAALDLRRRHFGESSLESAESLCDLGEHANARYDYRKATSLFQESLDLYRHWLGERHPKVARSLHGLGVASYNHGSFNGVARWRGMRVQDFYDVAEKNISEAISILHEHGQEVPALYFMDLGMALQRRKKYSASEGAYLEGIQASRRQFGDNSVSEAYIRFEYAQLLEARCEFEGAERMFRESLGWQRKLLGDRHPDLALSLNRFADFLFQKLEDYEESEALYLEALDIRGNFADCERFRRSSEKYRRRLCILYTKTGDISSAIDVMQGLTNRELEKPNPWNLIFMGDARFAGRDYSTADRYYQTALSSIPSGKESVSYARALLGSARVLAVRKDPDSAETVARRSVGVHRRVFAADDPRLADSLFVLGEILLAQSRYKDAEVVFHECLEIRRNTLTDQHSLTAAVQRMHHQCLAALQIDDSG